MRVISTVWNTCDLVLMMEKGILGSLGSCNQVGDTCGIPKEKVAFVPVKRVVYAILDVSNIWQLCHFASYCIWKTLRVYLPLEQLLHRDCCQCMLWTLEQNHLGQHSPSSGTFFHLANRQWIQVIFFLGLREDLLSQVRTKRDSISFTQMNTYSATSNLNNAS